MKQQEGMGGLEPLFHRTRMAEDVGTELRHMKIVGENNVAPWSVGLYKCIAWVTLGASSWIVVEC